MNADVAEDQKPDMASSDPWFTVAMLTYQRAGDLVEAIPAVLEQIESVGRPGSLMIIDNDPDGSAADAVSIFSGRGVIYEHEPQPGIAAARNRAIERAPEDSLLIFIDDDERPYPDWLSLLLATHARHRSAAVVGPVVSEFDVAPDPWIEAGRFFDRKRRTTGSLMDVAATNNLLLDLNIVNRLGLRFDESFGQSGGSDTLFTRRLALSGGSIIWCDEAIVTDKVPASRLTRKWVLKRALRSGNSWVRTSLKLAPSAKSRAVVRIRTVQVGGVRVLGGGARYVLGELTRSDSRKARGLRTVMRGVGMLLGAVGYTYQEYRRPSR